MKNCNIGLENAFSSPRSQFFTIRTDPKSANNTQIANMATMSPKWVFSVVTIAKGCPALFFQEFCSLSTEKLDAEIERKARSRADFIKSVETLWLKWKEEAEPWRKRTTGR